MSGVAKLGALASIALVVFSALLLPPAARAHETITAGDYTIEYGWLNEPPIVGQPNAIFLSISRSPAGSPSSGGLTIVYPADGAHVQGDTVQVTVHAEGLTHETHWHLYLDGNLAAMIDLAESTYTLAGLTDGEHEIKAVLSDGHHADVGEPSTVTIVVEHGGAAGASPTAAPEAHSHEAAAEVDVSGLKVEVSYGDQTRLLALQPLAEDRPGQFVAPLLPSRAGKYTVRLSGRIGESEVDVQLQPEEVQTADAVQFPRLEAGQPAQRFPGTSDWLAILGLLAGLAGAGMGLAALMRKK